MRERNVQRFGIREFVEGGQFREPEVENLDEAVARDHQILRLQISMDDAGLVGFCQPVRYLGRDWDCSLQRERSGDQQVAQQIALDQLHCNIEIAVDLSQLEDGHYVRVIQSRGRTGLPLKAFQILIIRRQVAGEEFDGNIAAQASVAGAIHLAHAARSERAGNFITPKL